MFTLHELNNQQNQRNQNKSTVLWEKVIKKHGREK